MTRSPRQASGSALELMIIFDGSAHPAKAQPTCARSAAVQSRPTQALVESAGWRSCTGAAVDGVGCTGGHRRTGGELPFMLAWLLGYSRRRWVYWPLEACGDVGGFRLGIPRIQRKEGGWRAHRVPLENGAFGTSQAVRARPRTPPRRICTRGPPSGALAAIDGRPHSTSASWGFIRSILKLKYITMRRKWGLRVGPRWAEPSCTHEMGPFAYFCRILLAYVFVRGRFR